MREEYIIGFSSGFFSVVGEDEKESLLTLPRKLFKGAVEGVNFTQVDLESITEFNEPYLKEGIKRMKKLGMRIGFHGEAAAMGGGEKPIGMLDSCIESHYIHAHERLIQHIEGCGKLGGEFVNIHPSETTPFIKLPRDLQPTKLVDPWGRPLKKFLEENPEILDWAIEQGPINDIMRAEFRINTVEDIMENLKSHYIQTHPEGPPPNESNLREEAKKRQKASLKRLLLTFISTSGLAYGPEMIAYFIIAKWMQKNKDSLWKDIVGKHIPDDKLVYKDKEWVPAVSSKYIWGHFNPKDPRYKDPKPLLKKYRIYFVFEAQMGSVGLEGLYRLTRPRDMAFLCKSIGSKYVGVCFDFEHVLSQNINPIDEIKS
ncbi:MAG: hypothetical protein GTN36_04870, partial [Candidatus Aenigmarchaeota archaeon]|nr:hypothetical protein [Candidatus Aenigmarchaeota archaeon]